MLKQPGAGDWSVRIPDKAWRDAAPRAGGVGRWVIEPLSGRARIDGTLRMLTGLDDWTEERDSAAFLDRIHAEDRAGLEAALAEVVGGADSYRCAFRFERPDGRTVWLDSSGAIVEGGDGTRYLVGATTDVTEVEFARERAELLAGEMAHRMKNVLALVGSMFNMAARGASSVEALREAYSGRLHALSKVNELTFTAEGERPARIEPLVEAVLGPLIATGRIARRIDPCELAPSAAQTFVLVLNELVTNATKHGALSVEGGRIELDVALTGDAFRLTWRERGGPSLAQAPTRQGYGMRVLSAMTEATYGGEPAFDWQEEGLTFSCGWPVGPFARPVEAP